MMSLPVTSLRVMSKKRRSRRAKQVRHDAGRANKHNRKSSLDTTLMDAIRSALAGEHPLNLLSLASFLIHVATPEPLALPKPDGRNTCRLDEVLTGLIGARTRETTALLAVFAELLVNAPAAQFRCRHELADRDEPLPQWISALSQVDVYRAVRRTHVLGDVDELVIGMRLNGGHELTVAVLIDHNMLSGIVDAGVVPNPIDEVLARVAESSSDTDVVEMTLADARVWIDDALTKPTLAIESETWPLYRALVRWLVCRLPEGGEHRSSTSGWESAEKLCDSFFATSFAAPFTESSHRELLLELFDTGSGDPLRWSTARIEQAIGGPLYGDDSIPLEVALDAPDLLRAFTPYAHAQSRIPDELTSRGLAVIDALRSSYKREVLRQADWRFDDAV
jgi:hypothetical protein